MGRKQVHEVKLTQEERAYLIKNTSCGDWSPRKVKRALILLKADKDGKHSFTDEEISQQLHCSHATVNNVREKFSRGERLAALQDKPRTGRPKIIDGDVEAHIIAIACSSPPEGRVRWTLELIAERIVALKCMEECSQMSVGRVLKKTNLSLG